MDRIKARLRHFTRFLALATIVWLIHQSHQDFLDRLQIEGNPIDIFELKDSFPGGVSLTPSTHDPEYYTLLNKNEEEIIRVTQTSPKGDSAIGFSGSTNLLVGFGMEDQVNHISIRSSGDTIEHVDAILNEPKFFTQFKGKTKAQLAKMESIEAVSGATLTSLAIADALALRFGGEKKASRFPQSIEVEEVGRYFPGCVQLTASKSHPSLLDVIDQNGTTLGQVGRTSPHADQIIGYQGPIDTLIILENNRTLKNLVIRSSFENEPYADYPNDDAYFSSLFQGRSLSELADMNLTEEEVEGVSGATMTSMAMAEGIIKTAQSWEMELNRKDISKTSFLWKARDTGSLAVIMLAGFVAFTKRGKTKFFRRSLQVLLVCYLGLVNGDILSQALFAGWAQNGIPWERAPILALLTIAALIVPMATGKSFYCHQLCPHGAAQQGMRKLRKNPIQIPKKMAKAMETIPFLLLAFVVFVALTEFDFPLANLEPFDGYVWEVAGGIAIAILLIGLVASAFVPMAYCRYGCPTGAMLKLFEFGKNDRGWNRRDYLSFTLLGFAVLLYFFS
ncbi:MAG: FMN-binding protein [Opitutales bacterium]|nr:FMN-binding protein [Opitutales bacterium]